MGFEEWFGEETGLVLNGGGGKGAYQIGVFDALRESGLNDLVTMIAGSSAGALNMCLFAYEDENIGREIWSNITPEQFVDPELSMIDGVEGFVSRDGLLELIDGYVDLNKVSKCPIDMYASVTEYDSVGAGSGISRYMKINGKTPEEIKQILLASSAMPYIYEPVKIDGLMYRDGGMTDNLPIKALYDRGIRQFIVVLLDKNGKFNTEDYPDCKFLEIRPSMDLGDTVTGTLDFTAKGAKWRMDLGYMDAARAIRLFGEPKEVLYETTAIELRQFENTMQVDKTKGRVESKMNRINDLFNRYE